MFLFLLIGYIIFSAGMYFVFPKAGVDAWKGLVPGLNLYELAGIVGRKKSHAWWMLFPIVNIFIFAALIIDLDIYRRIHCLDLSDLHTVQKINAHLRHGFTQVDALTIHCVPPSALAASTACSGDEAIFPGGTGMPNSANSSLAWYSWKFMQAPSWE